MKLVYQTAIADTKVRVLESHEIGIVYPIYVYRESILVYQTEKHNKDEALLEADCLLEEYSEAEQIEAAEAP